jgi:phosphate transport system permease protein
VVLPAAVSGIVAAFIIATSRAIGETMVATMAGGYDGSGPYNGFNPLEPGLTMTAAMTNAAGGTDNTKGGAAFEVLFFVGLLLFAITLLLNLIGDRFVQRVRQKY